MTYKFTPATIHHVKGLVDDISQDVKEEMLALKHGDLVQNIKQLSEHSDEAWTATYNDVIICVFGVKRTNLLSDVAYPWLITTNEVKRHKRNFLKGAKISIAYWLKRYNTLENYVPSEFGMLIKWVRWVGFTVFPAAPTGFHNKMVHKIEMRK